MRQRFLLLYAAAVAAVAISSIGYLALRFETVRLGYEVAEARRTQRNLIEEKRALEVEAASLRQPRRIEAIARDALEMEIPGPDRIVPMSRHTEARVRPAGRAR
ncbi:MAG: cell division protein FtsL [Myxococcales bacterium]|nr:cell division protein FtsL [Myxococcales bacterium]